MGLNPTQNGNYPVQKDSIVFYEGQENKSLNILLQGKVDVFLSPFDKDSQSEEAVWEQSFKLFEIDQNVILGANDLFLSKKHSFTYRASKDSTLFIFFANSMEQIKNLVDIQKDYGAYLISSIANIINSAFPAYIKIQNISKSINVLNDNLMIAFWYLKEMTGFEHTPAGSYFSEGLKKLQILKDNNFAFPLGFNASFFEIAHFNYDEGDARPSLESINSEINYYKHFVSIPIEIRKSFFSAAFDVTSYHCKQAASLLEKLRKMSADSLLTANDNYLKLYSNRDDCILKELIKAAEELRKNGSDISIFIDLINYAIKQIKEITATFETKYHHKYELDTGYLDSMVELLNLPAPKSSPTEPSADLLENFGGCDYIPDELKNSAEKILEYSEIPKAKADLFRINLAAFRNLKDKNSTADDARAIRSAVSSVFFEIYEAVFKRALKENNSSRLINMFLNFAYMDETLLASEDIHTLYKYAGSLSSGSQGSVFTIKSWFTEMYTMGKNPSVNEFGQDYFDVFREMKKHGEVTDKDKEEYDNNIDARLKHEIYNMFKVNHRLCYGQTSTYFPILHQDMFTRTLSKALVTPGYINECIEKILSIDFSAFHREVFYTNPAKGIEKELIMKSVTPDFILMPTYGSRAIMWQEISGRNRSSPGRMLIPIFTGENLDDMLVRLVGNFRWELCRTMMGTSWNDITQSSLTSDYTDYTQFFKKNKDLSDEAKEKVKTQIAKYNNRLREIFTADYEVWINYESKGVLRLNKVVRGILYKHCPFSKDIRSSMEKQPAYSDIAAQFNNIRNKKAKEIENRYKMLVRSGITLDPDMEENLKFYKER